MFAADQLEDHLIDQFIMGVVHDNVRKKILDQDPSQLTLEPASGTHVVHTKQQKQLHYFQDQKVETNIRQKKSQSARPQHSLSTSHEIQFQQVVDPHRHRILRPAAFSIRIHLNTAYHFSCFILI